MGQEYGNDWRVQIGDGATPEVFTNVGGEISFDWNRSSQEQDISTKDDGIYGSSAFFQQKITISVNGNVKLPDAGLLRVATVSKSAPPQGTVRLVKGATVKYEGLSSIGNFSTSHPNNGPVTFKFDIANVGAPATDDLGA